MVRLNEEFSPVVTFRLVQLNCNRAAGQVWITMQIYLILSHCLEKLNILACVCAYLDKALMDREQGEYKDTCIWVIPTKRQTIHPFEAHDRTVCCVCDSFM